MDERGRNPGSGHGWLGIVWPIGIDALFLGVLLAVFAFRTRTGFDA